MIVAAPKLVLTNSHVVLGRLPRIIAEFEFWLSKRNTVSNHRIFISYSHKLRGPEWKRRLLEHLKPFSDANLIQAWDDEQIPGGWRWEREIEKAIQVARLAVILLTKEALESEFILERELAPLSQREKDGLIVIPILCEPCAWNEHPWLKQVQIRPFEAKPLSTITDAAELQRVLRRLATEVAEELGRSTLAQTRPAAKPPGEVRAYLDKFPLTRGPGLRIEKLIGREQELALLDLAFAQPHTAIVSLVAWGGVGKTMLVQQWLQTLQRKGWFGTRRVYAWSFYSQGTKEDRQASEDSFLAHALAWFGVECEPTLSPWDKGRLLADAITRERTLLILDGIEPLQYPPGPMGGQLRAPGVQSLLKQLARKANAVEQRGLCLVTTREPLTDLADFERREGVAWGSVLRVDLGNLTDEAGAALLHHAGANRAGPAEIKADDAELFATSREVDGHALTLNLLGRFLAHAHRADIRRRDLVKFEKTDKPYEHAFKMLAAFEDWFNRSSDIYKHQLTILRLLGLFDRPVEADCIAALRRAPVIAGLTDSLFHSTGGFFGLGKRHKPLSDEDWNAATGFLDKFGLIHIQSDAGNRETLLDCHPLIRQHFSETLRKRNPQSFRVAHSRITDCLLGGTEIRPSTLEGIEPLYNAIAHGCLAGRFQEMVEKVYRDRINRGTHAGGFYSTRVLGAYSSDLSVVATFFSDPWNTIAPQIRRTDQGWVTYAAGFLLRAVGRLDEAIEPMRLGANLAVDESDWANAAIRTSNLSQALQLSGRIREAVDAADEAELYARRSSMANQVMYRVAGAGDSRHQLGDAQEAAAKFEEAEAIQAQYGGFPYLGSLQGHQFCELLLRRAERAAWSVILGLPTVSEESQAATITCVNVINRAQATLNCDRRGGMGALSLALSLLSIGRAAIYHWILVPSERAKKLAIVVRIVDDALRDLEKANAIQHLPQILMSRAEFLCSRGSLDSNVLERKESEKAEARQQLLTTAVMALDEAWDIAERGSMRLHLADIHLHRARLFFREKHYPWKSPSDDLAAAEKLINDCGYHRRDEELADAKRAILGTGIDPPSN